MGLSLLLVGCYESHVRPLRDAGPDAPVAWSPFDTPPLGDEPTCRASCERAVSLHRFVGESTELALPQLIVRDGTALVLFSFGGDLRRYLLYRVDVAEGRLVGRSEIPIFPPPESNLLMGALLGGSLDALTLTWTETQASSRLDWHATVRQQVLDRSGRPAAPVRELGRLSRRLRTRPARVSVLGREAAEAIAIFEGGTVGITPIDGASLGEESVVARLEDTRRGFGPIDGAALGGGGWALAIGGTEERLDPRDALLVVRRPDGSVTLELLPGEPGDPPTHVVASGDGFGVARLVSNPRVFDPRVLVQRRDVEGRVVDATAVGPASRFLPTAVTAFDHDGLPAAAWVERDRTLRVLPPPGSGEVGAWSECDGVATSPVLPSDTRLPSRTGDAEVVVTSMGDGSGAMLVLARNRGTYELFLVPGCRLDRVE